MTRIIVSDCVEAMAAMAPASVDAIVTDPPYGLGFMGRDWDNLPPGIPWAKQCLRVLKPGGHLLAFGGTRTSHRLVCAIEDAGFEIRDTIAWMYGSGFPKSLDVSKAIDKATGAEREIVGKRMSGGMGAGRLDSALPPAGIVNGVTNRFKSGQETINVTAPATPDAERWQGWGTALKPSHEPVVVAQKPLQASDYLREIGSRLDTLEAWLAQAADPTTQTGEAGGSSAPMATSPSGSTAITFSNTVTSWRNCWAEIWTAESTSTTSTRTRPTTDLKTLSSCLSAITREVITPAPTPSDGWRSLVPAVDSLFAAAVFSSRATLALSAIETVTGRTHTSCPDEDAPLRRPAHEPIVVARKPLDGTVAANVLRHGTGAINVDGCRIGMSDEDRAVVDARSGAGYGTGITVGAHQGRDEGERFTSAPAGRWPANVVLDEEAARLLDEQTGTLTTHPGTMRSDSGRGGYGSLPSRPIGTALSAGDSGGASRFFYVAKASSAERNAGLDGFKERGTTADGYGSIQTPTLDRSAPRENWTPHPVRNIHPTVKPIALMRWLVRLVTAPGGTVLDPFAGSGTTGCAAALEGFEFVGIEREAEYAAIAEARIAWWSEHPDGMALVRRLELEEVRADVAQAGQGTIFDLLVEGH